MRRCTIGSMLVMALLVHAVLDAGVSVADRARLFRIGALTASWGPTPMVVGMRDGLLELGYREDMDFFLGVRFTQGDNHALRAAAHELVQYGVDLLVVDTDEAALAAQQATTDIPIVFASVADPIGMGLAQSFARPGGNITGVTDMELHLGPKRLQMFKEMLPPLQRVLFPYDPSGRRLMTRFGQRNQGLWPALPRTHTERASRLRIKWSKFSRAQTLATFRLRRMRRSNS